jgi:hypothetical protein
MAYPVDPDKQKLAQQIQRDIQSGVPIDPELMEYAESIMPSLRPQKVLPDNYNSLAQKEALSQQNSQLPSNYNELAQDEANQQNPLPSNYNELAQEEAAEQDKFSEPMRLEKTPEEIKAYKEKMRKFYPYDKSFQEEEYEIPDTLKRPEQNTLTPEMRDYAYDIFPALEEIVPRRVNTTKEFEGKTADGLLKKEEAPKQKSPSTIKTPINEITKIVEKRKPSGAEEPSIDDMIKNIRSEQDRIALSKQSAKLRDAIMGAGIGQIKQTDVSRYEELAKRAERPLTDMLLKDELKDKQAKNDPNSNISMLTRNFLKERGVNMAGLENISYSQIEKLLPTFMNIINTEIAAKAKKEEAAVNRSIKEQLAEEKQYNRTRDIVNSKASKLLDNKNSPLSSYNQAKQASSIIDSAIESWDEQDLDAKIKNSVSFMQYAKIAQGDDSVVRSSDMQALAGSLNLRPAALLSKVFSKVQGQAFTKNELMEMKKVLDIIRKVKKEQLQSRINPIILDAQRGNYDISQSIDSSLLEEIYSKEPMSLDEKAKRREELRKKAAAEK